MKETIPEAEFSKRLVALLVELDALDKGKPLVLFGRSELGHAAVHVGEALGVCMVSTALREAGVIQ